MSGWNSTILGIISSNASVESPETAKFSTLAKLIASAQLPDAVMLSPANAIFN
jgi:hypothetical protein